MVKHDLRSVGGKDIPSRLIPQRFPEQRFVLWDCEFTCWEGSLQHLWSRDEDELELVQIGAVLVESFVSQDNQSIEFVPVSTFECLVKPRMNPKLSQYFCKLTGISQSKLQKDGRSLKTAINAFYEFTDHGAIPVFSWGAFRDLSTDPVSAILSDLYVLRNSCQLNSLEMPEFEAYDVRIVFEALGIETEEYSSGTIHNHFPFSDKTFLKQGKNQNQPHSALYDAKSIFIALRELGIRGKFNERSGIARTGDLDRYIYNVDCYGNHKPFAQGCRDKCY